MVQKWKWKKAPAGWEPIQEKLEEFERELREAVAEPHEGKRKTESVWPVHKIHYEKNRFIYDSYYKDKAISKELYEWLLREKIADAALIAKWKKPGYEYLCSLAAISRKGHNFGTVSICRVPLAERGEDIRPCYETGCITCCSSDPGAPIWWNSAVVTKKRVSSRPAHAPPAKKRESAAAAPPPPPAHEGDDVGPVPDLPADTKRRRTDA